MTSPWTNTTVSRASPEGGVSCWTWKRTPLATTSATAAHRHQAHLDVIDDLADPQGDDLVEVHVGQEPDEVDVRSVVRLHEPGQGHELDALQLEVAGKGGVHGHADLLQVVLADDLGQHGGDVGQDARFVHA